MSQEAKRLVRNQARKNFDEMYSQMPKYQPDPLRPNVAGLKRDYFTENSQFGQTTAHNTSYNTASQPPRTAEDMLANSIFS